MIGILTGLVLNTAVQLWMYHNFQEVFHQGDRTSAAYWAGFGIQFSWVKLVASGLLFMVLGELVAQKAEQRALVREIEAEHRAASKPTAPDAGSAKDGLIQAIMRRFNF